MTTVDEAQAAAAAKRKSEMASYVRGLARGLGPDILGGPVDLARDAANLGIAGVGYAGHKLGVLKEPLPLINPGAVGDSDWWARLAKVDDDQTPQYTAGRLTPLAATVVRAAGPAAARVTNALVERTAPARSQIAGPESQIGAIRVGGDPRLMPSHDTTLENLGRVSAEGTRIPELSNPSVAIAKDTVSDRFSGGGGTSLQLIPRVGAFDPATSSSTLFNRDAYTPRWRQFSSRPAANNDFTEDWQKRLQASRRLTDRLFPTAAGKDAAGRESGMSFMESQQLAKPKFDGSVTGRLSQDIAIKGSPAFRSFKDFERSAKGAPLLTERGRMADHDIYEHAAIRRAFDKRMPEEITDIVNDKNLKQIASSYLQAKAQGQSDPAAIREVGHYLRLSKLPENVQLEILKNKDKLPIIANDVQQAYRRSPSEYAELKVHGPVPVTGENFAGVVLRPGQRQTDANDAVIKALVDRGVPVVSLMNEPGSGISNSTRAFELADILQKQAGPARKQPLR